MTGRPAAHEFASYYSTYIDLIGSDDIVGDLASAAGYDSECPHGHLRGTNRCTGMRADKWSIRELLNHVSDTERVFVYRALWFARGFDTPLPGFDQNVAVPTAAAEQFSWASHVEDFRAVRAATLTFFRNLPEEAWGRSGVASGNPVTVRALAYIIAGHVAHHIAILQERYL